MDTTRSRAAPTSAVRQRNCRDCQQFQLSHQGPRCRFRGGPPRGICAVFKRQSLATPNPR